MKIRSSGHFSKKSLIKRDSATKANVHPDPPGIPQSCFGSSEVLFHRMHAYKAVFNGQTQNHCLSCRRFDLHQDCSTATLREEFFAESPSSALEESGAINQCYWEVLRILQPRILDFGVMNYGFFGCWGGT